MHRAKLSVIIASYNSQKTIERCLQSFTEQVTAESFEVIVVDSSQDRTGDLIACHFPGVKLYRFEERKYPGDARNFGVEVATGEVLAFTDADCFVPPDWVDRLIQAHGQTSHPVIGGAVDNGNPDSYIGWAYYFCEFSQWIPQSASCYLDDIPTTCLSPKRWAFDRYGPFLEGVYCSDTDFNWKLARAGFKPLFVPDIQVSHINIDNLNDYLGRKVRHGRYFAWMRVKSERFSFLRRAAYVLLWPLLPFLLFGRRTALVLGKQKYLKEYLLAVPLVFLGLVAWSYGECLGYLSATRRS
ncbi:MAG: glycosyltransferase [Gemmatimonadaceae bacterium]|nr:glycosyltransferase [Gloeobacterales cyanobacterium ES-bin-141]